MKGGNKMEYEEINEILAKIRYDILNFWDFGESEPKWGTFGLPHQDKLRFLLLLSELKKSVEKLEKLKNE
jgi:hypothetical protein